MKRSTQVLCAAIETFTGFDGKTDLREIESAFAKITVHGGRMDAKQMDQIDKDCGNPAMDSRNPFSRGRHS